MRARVVVPHAWAVNNVTETIIAIENKLNKGESFVSRSRVFILDSQLMMKAPKGDEKCYVVLFNDLVLVCDVPTLGKHTVLWQLPVNSKFRVVRLDKGVNPHSFKCACLVLDCDFLLLAHMCSVKLHCVCVCVCV